MSRVEDLPNELFLNEIYPYFSPEKLCQTFAGLNQRLDSIIRLRTHLKFVVDHTPVDHPALLSLKPFVACLTICLGQFDIIGFTNVRALTLKFPSLQQRNAIRPENFPSLTYLELSYPLEDRDLLNVIFSDGFRCLKTCKFDRILTDHTWNGTSTLNFVQASVSGEYGITSLLRSSRNLSRLSVIVYNELQRNLVLPSYSISCEKIHSLQTLFIRSRFSILLSILKLMPNLKRLTFEDITKFLGGSSDNSMFTWQLLSDSLRNLPELSYLHFTIEAPLTISKHLVRTLHPLFQCIHGYDRHWTISSSDSTDDVERI